MAVLSRVQSKRHRYHHHEMLFQIAQKSQVYAIIQQISIHFNQVRNMALNQVKDRNIVDDHTQIVQVLLERDSAKAKAKSTSTFASGYLHLLVLKEVASFDSIFEYSDY